MQERARTLPLPSLLSFLFFSTNCLETVCFIYSGYEYSFLDNLHSPPLLQDILKIPLSDFYLLHSLHIQFAVIRSPVYGNNLYTNTDKNGLVVSNTDSDAKIRVQCYSIINNI